MAKASTNRARSTLRDPQLPPEMYLGYNAVTGQSLSTAVTGEATKFSSSSTAIVSVCLSTKDVAAALGVSESFSVNFGPEGHGSEKMKFFLSLKTTTYSLSIVVRARHVSASWKSTDVRLKTNIKPPSSLEDLNTFVAEYGDSYVAALNQGGEYYAVYTFYSQSSEEQIKLQAEIKGAGIVDGAEIDGDLQAKFSKFLKETSIRYEFKQQISGFQNPKMPARTDVIRYAHEFSSLQLDTPVSFDLQWTGYEHVPGIAGNFRPVSKNRDVFIGNSGKNGLAAKFVAIQDLLNQAAIIRSIYDTYGGYDDQTLTSRAKTANEDRDEIGKLVQAYNDDPTAKLQVPPLDSATFGSPRYQLVHKVSDPWGGAAGKPFNDIDDYDSYIQNHTRIVQVTLRGTGQVNLLKTTYKRKSGRTDVKEHGKKVGRESMPLNLGPGEFISEVSGLYAQHLWQLFVKDSNGGQASAGSDVYIGKKNKIEFRPPKGSFVMGFAGRSLAHLVKLQVIYGSFKPAKWPTQTAR